MQKLLERQAVLGRLVQSGVSRVLNAVKKALYFVVLSSSGRT